MRSSVLDGSRNTSSALDEQQIERHVQDVAQSAQFLRAETLRKLLLYLWEHRHEDLSEYAVALEALGRRADFDPKTDASVRVQISRLRRKLKDFYEFEGAGETYQLQIPMGTHMITALEAATSPALPPPEPFHKFEEVPRSAPFPDVRSLALAVFASLTILLAILCAALLREHFTRPRSATIEQPVSFWTVFLQGGAPVKIILPTPVFFTIPTRDTLHVRDTSVNRYDSWQQSPLVHSLVPSGGSPTLDHSYTVTTDTLAAVSLARYLDRVGLGRDVSFEVTGQAGSMDLLEHASVVAFGAHSTLQPFRDYLATMNFSLATHEAWGR